MPRLTRTDVHRPSAIDPADYRFVAFDYLRNVEAEDAPLRLDFDRCPFIVSQREVIRQDMVRTGGTWSNHAHGGNCMVCGNANAYYTATFHHAPTNTYVRMGSDCSHHVNAALDHEEFARFRNRIRTWIEQHSPEVRAELRRRGFEQFEDFVGLETAPEQYEERTIHDMISRFVRYGSLTERQWDYMRILADRIANRGQQVATQVDTRRRNQFPGNCRHCRGRVEAGDGYLERVEGRWTVEHATCPVQGVAPTVQVGDLRGVMALFDRARPHLQYPAIILDVPYYGAIRLSVAGERARVPGSINVVKDERPNEGERRPWLGRILQDGTFDAANNLPENVRTAVLARLREFALHPAEVASQYGRLHGRCCFCRLPLTDARSTAVGYGEICAGHYGLPWGERPTEFAAPVTPTSPARRDPAHSSPPPAPPAAAPRLTPRRTHLVIEEAPPILGRAPVQPQLPFDAVAERKRLEDSGQTCPGCEGGLIRTHGPGQFECRECGVCWNRRNP